MRPLLGVDLGDARTGIAISDELGLLAHPLETIASNSSRAVAQRVKQIATERNVQCIVIGLPRHMNGAYGTRAGQAQRFAEQLRGIVPCEVVTWDERLSTQAAERSLREAGKKTRRTRAVVDQVAAQTILQNYLDRLNA